MKQVDGASWVLHPNHVNTDAYMEGAFTWDECDEIIRLGKQGGLKPAQIIGSDKEGQEEKDFSDIRKSKVYFMHPNENTAWIYRKLTGIVENLNQQFFRFDLYNFGEAFQFTEYSAPGEHYTWHVDMAIDHTPRKLSIAIQLTDPDEYEGGDFEIWHSSEPTKLNRQRGTVLVFPSYQLHRVTPVTKGTRNSLVAWVGGPCLK